MRPASSPSGVLACVVLLSVSLWPAGPATNAFAPVPGPDAAKRSLKEDWEQLLQFKGGGWAIGESVSSWRGPLVEMDYEKKKQKCRPALLFHQITNRHRINFPGMKKFFRPGSHHGILSFGVLPEEGGMCVTSTGFRLEEKGKRRFLILAEGKDGEIQFEYQLEGTTLKLKGDEKLKRDWVTLDIAVTFTRSAPKKK
jgi:hypothetical protein